MANNRQKRNNFINLIFSDSEREIILKASSIREIPKAVLLRSIVILNCKKIIKEAGNNE